MADTEGISEERIQLVLHQELNNMRKMGDQETNANTYSTAIFPNDYLRGSDLNLARQDRNKTTIKAKSGSWWSWTKESRCLERLWLEFIAM